MGLNPYIMIKDHVFDYGFRKKNYNTMLTMAIEKTCQADHNHSRDSFMTDSSALGSNFESLALEENE